MARALTSARRSPSLVVSEGERLAVAAARRKRVCDISLPLLARHVRTFLSQTTYAGGNRHARVPYFLYMSLSLSVVEFNLF